MAAHEKAPRGAGFGLPGDLQNRSDADPLPHGEGDDMAHYIRREFSVAEVRASGKALAGKIEVSEDAIGIFRTAHNFRMEKSDIGVLS